MGQIIPFPAAALAYPGEAGDLDDAEAVLLLAMRWWVTSIRRDEDPVLRLELGLDPAGLLPAVAPLDFLMTVVARTARRQLTLHCPRCPALSADEAHLLEAASLGQAEERALALRALALVLGNTHGAEFALEPLLGVSALFAAAGRVLRRRRLPAAALH